MDIGELLAGYLRKVDVEQLDKSSFIEVIVWVRLMVAQSRVKFNWNFDLCPEFLRRNNIDRKREAVQIGLQELDAKCPAASADVQTQNCEGCRSRAFRVMLRGVKTLVLTRSLGLGHSCRADGLRVRGLCDVAGSGVHDNVGNVLVVIQADTDWQTVAAINVLGVSVVNLFEPLQLGAERVDLGRVCCSPASVTPIDPL
jgi:hypothetical protein